MVETYFTSDHHFGNKNILEYEKKTRPFESIEEMNEQLVTNWNETVKQNDIVFYLGDFAFGATNIAIADKLHGDKRLIMGNHDNCSLDLYLRHFQKVFGVFYWKKCILTHIPIHPAHFGRYCLNVHGHLHSKEVQCGDERYFNVSVERHNLRPVHSSVLLERIKQI